MGNYDNFAKEYAENTAKMEEGVRKHYYSLLPSKLKGKKILDVGCGSGQDAVHYNKKGAKVFGVDISKKEIEMAKTLNIGEFVVGDMKKLPYKDNEFDIVTSYYALQSSEYVKKSLREMARVAKKGATILIISKHPARNLLEGWKNNNKNDYYSKGIVTSRIFNKKIILNEPAHTFMDYFDKDFLKEAHLDLFEEHTDFPASEQVVEGLNYPTFFIMRLKKL